MSKNELENKCYQNYLNCNNNYEAIQKYCLFNNISIENFFAYVFKYIKKNIKEPEYVKVLDTLSACKSNEDTINYLKSINADYKYLNSNFLPYFYYYRPHLYYLDSENVNNLRQKLINYENYLYRELNPLRVKAKDRYEYMKELVINFINSDFSLARFCYNKGLSLSKFKLDVNVIKNNNKNLYDEYLKNITLKESIKEQVIKNDIYNILNIIKNNNFISIIEFCMTTKYDISEITKEANNILEIEDKKLIGKYLGCHKTINVLRNERLNILFRTNFIFNIDNQLVELTDEDKYAIISYLNTNNIPICNDTFKECFIKLYNKKKSYCKTK